jgi:hypothetical protein
MLQQRDGQAVQGMDTIEWGAKMLLSPLSESAQGRKDPAMPSFASVNVSPLRHGDTVYK